MPKTAFLKGFADGFFSPFTFFLPPVKPRRAPMAQALPYQKRPLPDVSPAAAWAKVNAQLAQAIQRQMGEENGRGQGDRGESALTAKSGGQ